MASYIQGLKWHQWALVAAGAAAAGAALYFLLREDAGPSDNAGNSEKAKVKVVVSEVTVEQVLAILEDIVQSQEKMKEVMRKLTRELIDKNYSFEQTYQRVQDVQPEDPLERYGLSMPDFDRLLDKHQGDERVRKAISSIMGAPPSASMSSKVATLQRQEIVDVHEFMLRELAKIVEEFKADPRRGELDMKSVTIAAQALVGARVEEKYGLSSEDIEGAVMLHHQVLAMDPEFARVNMQMQSAMSELMGAQFPA